MAPPRASRRRVIEESDDEATTPVKADNTFKNRQTVIQIDTSSPAKPSSVSTPPKSKKRDIALRSAQPNVKKDAKGTITSFFGASMATETATKTTATSSIAKKEIIPIVDDVEDDIEDDRMTAATSAQRVQYRTNGSSFTSKKRTSTDATKDSTEGSKITQGFGKFLKRNDGARLGSPAPSTKAAAEADSRPWTEKFAPQNLDELQVHKKKVSDVRQWLQGSLTGDKHKKLLVLKGSAGTGKTTTMRLLSSALDYDLVEWRNPATADYTAADYMPLLAQFEDFIGRGQRFGMLDIVSTNVDAADAAPEVKDSLSSNRSQVLLVEEFPNHIGGNTIASAAFRSSLLQVLSAPTNTRLRPTPLVMIISESVLSSVASSADNHTAHRLLGPEILHHPSTAVIEFNAMAMTFTKKALDLVLEKRSREVGRFYSPHKDVLKKLSEFGDVRNATSTLEFLCLQKGDATSVLPSRATSKTTKKSQHAQSVSTHSSSVDSDFALIALRQSSIGLFHAVGKVVYSKRTETASVGQSTLLADELRLPAHLKHHVRPLPSEVDPDTLIDETGTDPSTFISALHENYLLSCRTPDKDAEGDLDLAYGCLQALCDADILSCAVGGRSQYSGAGEELRQSELAFQVGVRGLLFTLKHPVKREAFPGRPRGEAFKMFYPASLKLWRKREEMHDLVELLATKAMNDKLLQGLRLQGIESSVQSTRTSSNDTERKTCIGSGQSPLQEMLLERLPFLVHLLSRDQSLASTAAVKNIQQVTRFTGVRLLQDDDEYDESGSAFDNLLKPAEVKKRGLGFLAGPAWLRDESGSAETLDVEKLVLSDDDIEDD